MIKFKKGEIPELKFQKAVKKPIAINCIKVEDDFEVETIEGIMKGKKGDYLIVGVYGEMYPIDAEIFMKTYNIVQG